ncbi:MAG: hypothetical protein JOS17DRAFT_845003, partial [Linnemannia elongata]
FGSLFRHLIDCLAFPLACLKSTSRLHSRPTSSSVTPPIHSLKPLYQITKMLAQFLTRPAMLTTILLNLLLTLLPIPSRAAETSNSSGGNQVQFPASSPSCVACQPAFSTPACQTILSSISSSSSSSLSNSTLAACQCSGSFLSLYSNCVKCFTETNQVSLVFGSPQAPPQSSLEDYCKAIPTSVTVRGGGWWECVGDSYSDQDDKLLRAGPPPRLLDPVLPYL